MATAIRRAIGKQMIRAINNASSHRILYSQLRFKCYLVGVDGSSYGYSALKTASTIATPEDKLISVYFPPNIALYTMGAGVLDDIEERQKVSNEEIRKKCEEIFQLYGHKNVDFTAKVGPITFSPKDDLIAECYELNADFLILGAKGIAHSFKEKISEAVHRMGSVADYCVHHAPCDVMIVKKEHDNVKYK